jgi:hypothetical protein
VVLETHDVLVRVAEAGKLYQGVLNATSDGHGMTQRHRVLTKLGLKSRNNTEKATLKIKSHSLKF